MAMIESPRQEGEWDEELRGLEQVELYAGGAGRMTMTALPEAGSRSP